MRRAQVTLTCHACGERFDAIEAQEVILPHLPQEPIDSPLTARAALDADAEMPEPEPRYARASDHEPLTRYQSLRDVWRHLGAEPEDDDADGIVSTLPNWLQKKDNGESTNAESTNAGSTNAGSSTLLEVADASSQNEDVSMDDTLNAASKIDDVADDTNPDATTAPEESSYDGLSGRLTRPSTIEPMVDLSTIEQHLPVLPEVGAIEAEKEKPKSAQQINWPLAILGAMVLVIGLLGGAIFY